jgi:hypothetical protein
MKKPVRVTIDKETTKSELTSYISPFEVTETTTVLELKTIIKESIKFPYELVKETLWISSSELKDDEALPKNGRFEYDLLIK